MDAGSLFHLLVMIIVVGLICWLVWWLIDYIGLPEPFNKIAHVLVAAVAVLFLISVVLSMGGGGGIRLPRW